MVYISWVKLYHRLPLWWETVCIFLHDVGHWGKNYSDDLNAKREHWKAGAGIAGKLFGRKGFDLVAGHVGYNDHPKSLLYKPDKYSWYIAPYWWLWWNNVIEPYIRCGMKNREAILDFRAWVKRNIESGEYRSTHDAHTERQRRQTRK
ncbi:unnamed protein product [marine sediment metagenome]|uniref:HD domain-containing protein n=1 Tax=marine sediment metagenome TaxID=412755 RepID=X1SFW1_9ZZZZ